MWLYVSSVIETLACPSRFDNATIAEVLPSATLAAQAVGCRDTAIGTSSAGTTMIRIADPGQTTHPKLREFPVIAA